MFDWVVGAGMPFYQALQMPMPLVLRLELQQWRRACAGIFEALEHAQAATEAWAWEAS